MQDAPLDSRFPTFNTDLAACLAALRIPIKTTDPVYVVEDGEGSTRSRKITYFFEQESAPSNDGFSIEKSDHVQWAWRHRKEFEKDNPKHPLVYMRRAIDWLEWLLDVKGGKITPIFGEPYELLRNTDDVMFAAVVMGTGIPLHSYSRGSFSFAIDGTEEWERIIEEYSCFRHGKDPICYMRKVLEARKELIALVKRAPVLLRYQAGEKEGLIPKGISAEKLNQFFELLYE